MKVLIVCSKAFYKKVDLIKEELEKMGHIVELPNSCDKPDAEEQSWRLGKEEHSKFVAKMFKISQEKIIDNDAVLALNFDKNGKQNYIGGATFIELYEAFIKQKKIFLYNDIPQGMLYDEISAFCPIVINGDISLVK